MSRTHQRIQPFPGHKFIIGIGALVTIWAVAALYYDVRISWLSLPAACLYAVLVIATLWHTRGSRKGILLWLGTLLLLLTWWFFLAPSGDRAWLPDVAEMPWADRQGDLVTIHHVRNFSYRTETDYTPKWETRTVDLSHLRGVDLFLTHFGSPWIAHPSVSFHFRDNAGNDTYLATSIEQRKTIGQTYSTLRGFFRQYELIYLIADERDVIRLRTNYRTGEDVRLYHTLTNPTMRAGCFFNIWNGSTPFATSRSGTTP